MALAQRELDFKIQLGTGSFGEGGSDTINLSGLRASAIITKTGVPGMNSAVIRIYGMTLSAMNQLTRIGMIPSAVRDNIVTVMAGTGGTDMSLVFAGGIDESWADFVGAPEVAFNMIAHTGLLGALKKTLPTSYEGKTDVANIMADLAKKMGYKLENNGVSFMLENPYLPGTARAQALAAAEAADIYVVFDDDKGIMALLLKGQSRAGVAPIVSPQTGLVGYPSYVGPGLVKLRTLYNPAIRFMGNVNVQGSGVTPANGLWRVHELVHNLESQTPKGAWFSDITGDLLSAGR